MTTEIIIMATHMVILATAVIGAVSSLMNRKKINEIHVMVNGGLTEKIKAAFQDAKER